MPYHLFWQHSASQMILCTVRQPALLRTMLQPTGKRACSKWLHCRLRGQMLQHPQQCILLAIPDLIKGCLHFTRQVSCYRAAPVTAYCHSPVLGSAKMKSCKCHRLSSQQPPPFKKLRCDKGHFFQAPVSHVCKLCTIAALTLREREAV